DGVDEIFFADGNTGQLRALRADGTALPGWPMSNPNFGFGTPAIADLDGDGTLEIVTVGGNSLYAFHANGTLVQGFPAAFPVYNDTKAFPVVGDVDGDGLPDIVMATRIPAANPDQALLGQVHVFDRHGVPHARFPKTLPIGVPAAPAIADIDGDGRNEIVIAGNFLNGEQGFFDKVWVFDLGGPPHGPVLWGQFMGNAKHRSE